MLLLPLTHRKAGHTKKGDEVCRVANGAGLTANFLGRFDIRPSENRGCPPYLYPPPCDLVTCCVSQAWKEREQLEAQQPGCVLLKDDRRDPRGRDLDRRAGERGKRCGVRLREGASKVQSAGKP